MNKQELTKLIKQLKKYHIANTFESPETLDNWLKKLTNNQITNLNNLDINPEEIKFSPKILINEHLLACNDYQKRILAMSKLKNEDGCWQLFERLCSPNFLNCPHYYQDLELISHAPTARYALWIIDDDNFINSKYHHEDLKLIIESQISKNNYLITEALTELAHNKDSINGPYHSEDMLLISQADEECLSPAGAYSKGSLNSLATDKISLQDPYHIENMQILSRSPISNEVLYELMTNSTIINSKNYRDEINAVKKAKSITTAIAMYYYIINPHDYSLFDFSSLDLFELAFNEDAYDALNYCYRYQDRKNNQPGNLNPKYLEYLNLLNEIDDNVVPYFESLLSNTTLINSNYYEQDLKLLLEITDPHIYYDLYLLMTNNVSLNNSHHLSDTILISNTSNERTRRLLIEKATSEHSVNSPYHEYDMIYISKLNFSKIKDKIFDLMYYYLFNPKGIASPEHIKALEKLANGEIYEPVNPINDYLNSLESQLPSFINDSEEYKITETKEKVLTRLKKIFTSKK